MSIKTAAIFPQILGFVSRFYSSQSFKGMLTPEVGEGILYFTLCPRLNLHASRIKTSSYSQYVSYGAKAYTDDEERLFRIGRYHGLQ